MNRRRRKTVLVATGAVLAAVVCVLNFVASLHIVRLDVIFYLVSGALVYFAAASFGTGAGAALYAVSSALSFLIVPDKVWLLFFIGVFGPSAVVQAVLEKKAGKRAAAVLAIVVFVLLFYLFGVVIAYGGGFVPLLGLPEAGMPMNLILAMGFAVFSAIIAYFVNRGFCGILSRRLGGAVSGKAATQRDGKETGEASGGSIVLPKLWNEEQDGER